MKIKTTKRDLQTLLARVADVANHGKLEALNHLRIEVSAGSWSLTANNLEMELRHTLPVEHEGEGVFTVLSKPFAALAQKIDPDAEVVLEVDGLNTTLRAKRGRYVLPGISPEDIPALNGEAAEAIRVPSGALCGLIAYCQSAMAVNDIRYYLNGLLLEVEPAGLIAAATDGHRLAQARIDLPAGEHQPAQLILPSNTVTRLRALLEDAGQAGEVAMRYGTGYLEAEVGVYRLRSRLVDGKFPDWRRVLISPTAKSLVSTQDLRQALQRIGIFADSKYNGMRVVATAEGLTLNTGATQACEEQLAADGDWQADVGLRIAYLLDALGAAKSERVCIGGGTENSSVLVTEEGDDTRRTIIMPMRL